ncbi:MAG: hypothetical protein ACLQVM_25370 [Terriglobia bacterium]
MNVMGVEGSYRDPAALVLEGIARLREFFNKLGLPAAMSALGIDEAKLELMAKKATGEAYGAEHSLGGLENLGWRNKHD